MTDLYREVILEEYKHPQNKNKIDTPTHTKHEVNPLCGDELTIELRVEEGKIVSIGWSGRGCAISQASASLFTEEIKGKTIEEVQKMDEQTILELLGITPNPMRMKCAVLVMKATANALKVKS